ncbi:MAG: nicotinamide-nucleotide amidase [Phenylobacterium sp.]|jgi:nicotinamide-nucleotide amidase
MRIELISTGDELLTGDIIDTNASWLAQQLTEAGYKLSQKTTVGDDLDELVTAFTERSVHADFIIVNGGLGPTSDDLSSEAAAKALGEPVVLFEQWLETMKAMFDAFNRTMTENNIKQAMLPQSASIVNNPVGTACGFKIKLNKAVMVFTPGVPREFKRMVSDEILPLLNQLNDNPPMRIERFLCLGVGESALANQLKAIDLPAGCEFGYRAAMPFIEVKIFASNQDLPQSVIDQVAGVVEQYCVVRQGNSLSKHVHQLLLTQAKLRRLKFATVESCTGGLVASALVAYAGSSAYLDRGLVTYSNLAKTQLASVAAQVIEENGAVSIEVAQAMAQGAINQHDLDLSVSITGIAGPEGGSEHKPVGTVAFALADRHNVYSQMLLLPNRGRNTVQQTALAIALDMVRRYLNGLEVIDHYDSYKAVCIK